MTIADTPIRSNVPLRTWQRTALDQWMTERPRDFLAVATPGAGKTTFALQIAAELLASKRIRAVTVVAPTEHLKQQWADAATKLGVRLDPRFTNAQGATGQAFDGVVVTYAQVASHPMLHRARTENRKTLVILDEIHHAGDAMSWGSAVREAFEPAAHRLALTGTPFRSDINAIPFVRYAPDGDGLPRSGSDHSYGYADALRDGVVRPVLFLAYSGEMRWRTRAGDEVAARLGEDMGPEATAQALRTALDPKGEWVGSVLTAADQRLTEVRRGMPDAGGLVIATDHANARVYARMLSKICGEKVPTVLSDDPKASAVIEKFATSSARWLVAVRMVSEGVDIPRLAVGVYATTTTTPLFFAQAVGRFVRARRRGETASIFLPSIPSLLQHAAMMEEERDHVLGRVITDEADLFAAERELLEQAAAEQTEQGLPDGTFEALESAAHFDRVVFDGGEFGHMTAAGSAEEHDYLGLPGLLEPDQVAVLLKERQAKQAKTITRAPAPHAAQYRAVADLRRELSGLVSAWHHRTGQPHGVIHGDLRSSCGGPLIALADADEIQQRIDTLRTWAVARR
ncbi:MAG: DEAD/DEAH box helicase [Actinomycetes bacterium]